MNKKTRVGLTACTAALALSGVSTVAMAAEGNVEGQLEAANAKIAAMDAKIAALEAANNVDWLTEQRAEEIRGLVQDVLADADTRASLLQNNASSGYDDGFILGDSGGGWLLRTNLLMQHRFIWNSQDNEGDDGEFFGSDSHRAGFETTRAKVIWSGHVVNPSWFYRLDVNFGNNGEGRDHMLNGYVGHDYGSGWKIMMGTMKLPLLREELVEAQYQLAVERSNVNYNYTGGYADGLAVDYKGDQFHFQAMYSDGVNTGNTIWSTYDTEYALTARGEFLVNGNWDQFHDFTSPRGGETGVMIGAAAHYQDGEYGTSALETKQMTLTADVSVEFGGANLFAAVIYNDFDTDIPGGGSSSINPWGIVLQGGFYLDETWELYGRYEWSDYDSSAEDLNLVTVGVNKYFHEHNVKWTTDLGYGFDQVVFANNITGLRGDAFEQDGQWVLRTQWQLLF